MHNLIPTLCVGMNPRTIRVRIESEEAERLKRHSHAERGNEDIVGRPRSYTDIPRLPLNGIGIRSELRLGDLDRLWEAAGLVDGLPVFAGRVAVEDDAAAGLDVGRPAAEDERPEGDAG